MYDLILSDDDEEIIEYINSDLYNKRFDERTNHFNSLNDKDFHLKFRLSKKVVLILLEKIKDKLEYNPHKKEKETISALNQILCTLYFYATGCQLLACGHFIGIHESTVSRIVHRVTDAIAQMYPQYIHMPVTVEKQKQAAIEFYRIAHFPRVIGAIDCTHIRIKSPGGDQAELFKNKNGYFSIKVQAICSANLIFTDVVARWHGSANKSHIWDNCNQKRQFVQKVYGNHLLLGDSDYEQTKFIMTPLSSINTQSQALYNEAHAKSRNVIKQTFGVWKRRFPILSRGLQVNLSRIPGIIIATCVLHNIAQQHEDPEPPLDPEYAPKLDDHTTDNYISESLPNTPGEQARDELIIHHFGLQ